MDKQKIIINNSKLRTSQIHVEWTKTLSKIPGSFSYEVKFYVFKVLLKRNYCNKYATFVTIYGELLFIY